MDKTTNLTYSDKNPEDIRTDIERTRSQMEGTVEEIKEKFTPEHIKARMKHRVMQTTKKALDTTSDAARRALDTTSDAARRALDTTSDVAKEWTGRAKDWGGTAVETVKRDPLTYVSIGTGVGMGLVGLVWALHKRGTNGYASQELPPAGTTTYAGESPAQGVTETAKEKIEELKSEAKAVVGDVKENIVEEYIPRSRNFLQRNPVLVGSMLIAIGSLMGAFIPDLWKR